MRDPWLRFPPWLDQVREAPPLPRKLLQMKRARMEAKAARLQREGGIGAVWRPDGPEVFEAATPLSALLEKEQMHGTAVDNVFSELLAYSFSEGPHPAHVGRRLFDLALELRPRMVGDLVSPEVMHGMRGRLPQAHRWRVTTMIEGTRKAGRSADDHEKVIDATLRLAVARRADRPRRFAPIEMSELLACGADEELSHYERRMRGFNGLLGFLFDEGGTPGVVTRRIYCLAKWRPTTSDLLHDMSLHQLGLLFGEVRATWSWRVKNVINRMFTYRGVKGGLGSFQKSETACRIYAEAQEGNQNRRGGVALRQAI